MPIQGAGEGLRDQDEGAQEEREGERLVYVLHPNCAVEEV
jgi:hypothetical protein